ncbi:hypothetical protein HOC80_03390 [archaeon]|jgi:CheY-like chemotaxis protein|nr:hypothetical protein [archaeon]MBT4417121.1 hypothetical protein [archaeon]
MERILIIDNYRSSAEILGDYLQEQAEDPLDVKIATDHASALDQLKGNDFDRVYMTSDMPLRIATRDNCPNAIIEMVNLERVVDRADKQEVLEALLYVPPNPYEF